MSISSPRKSFGVLLSALFVTGLLFAVPQAKASPLSWDDVRIVIDLGGGDRHVTTDRWHQARDHQEDRGNWRLREIRKLEAKYDRFETRAWRDGVLTRKEYRKLRRLERRVLEAAHDYKVDVEYRY